MNSDRVRAFATGVLGTAGSFVRMACAVDPWLAMSAMACRLARVVVPVARLWVAKLIIDQVLSVVVRHGSVASVWRYFALELLIVTASDLLSRGSALTENLLGDAVSTHLTALIMERAAGVDLAQTEAPVFLDALSRAERQSDADRVALLAHIFRLAQDSLTVVVLATALASQNIGLTFLLLGSVLPPFFGDALGAIMVHSFLYNLTPQRRQLEYLRSLVVNPAAAKEIRALQLGGWIVDRFRRLAQRFLDDNRRLSTSESLRSAVLAFVGSCCYYGAYAIILVAALKGRITVGQMTFLAGSFVNSRDYLQRLLTDANDTFKQSLQLRDAFAFLDRDRQAPQLQSLFTPYRVVHGITFDNVSFRYPDRSKWAVRSLNFSIRLGECVALVGENGAGKTTLTKLLAGLYRPTEGRILVDDQDLAHIDPERWRAAVAVMFQDSVRYQMRFDENVAIGHLSSTRDYLNQSALPNATALGVLPCIGAATRQARATNVLHRCPNGYFQQLGTSFGDGIELSGGEWQKIALARTYLRTSHAQLIILDEPSSALDARAERELFRQLREVVSRRISVLISHRFSATKYADRVLVLVNGQIAEDGDHDQLIAARGLYAELFEIQANPHR